MVAGTKRYTYYDGKGNVTAVTDSESSVVAAYAYDPFGVLMEKTGTLDQPFRFSTKRYDGQTGLSYYGYRFYSAALGRWLSRDPLGEAGGVNLYGFVGNDGINGVDPLGLMAFPWHMRITYLASRDSGNGIWVSLSLAIKTGAVDFNGSQRPIPADTVQHAMASPGQSCEDAIANATAYIQSNKYDNLPGAIHAQQDLYTLSHAGKEWKGFDWTKWATYQHILGDIFISSTTNKHSYRETYRTIRRANY